MKRNVYLFQSLFLALVLMFSISMVPGCNNPKSSFKADVIIYGGTSAAVTAAVQLVRMDKSVIIVCPDKHLGGLTSSGLGFTDTGNKAVIGGLSREFYQRIYNHYQKEEAWKWQEREEYGNKGQGTPAIDGDKKTMWIFEPHAAESVFESFVHENNLKVYRDEWLDRENGVEVIGGEINEITMLSGNKYKGEIFIDATYEGDLMAAAGVSYFVGREANDVYNETWNGIQVGGRLFGHHFGNMQISPYVVPGDSTSGILPLISPDPPGTRGEGDHRVQAYCFRTCLTKVEENRIPFQKPENYDPDQYALLLRVLDAGWRGVFRKFDPIPNLKTDVNNNGPVSFDNIGMNYDYPEADYERRKEIIRQHEDYQKGMLYFYANDPHVPDEIREEMQQWGLSKDEFQDNGNWPHQIYVREARRMIGTYVMTENEIVGKTPVTESIGMGSYTMDSHNVQRYITPEGYVQNEGDVQVHHRRSYRIAMGTIIPKAEDCKNLLVPVAVSSSHIAFGSIRMEPVFMILGQSAAVIAAEALEEKSSVQQVNYGDIKNDLLDCGQVLE